MTIQTLNQLMKYLRSAPNNIQIKSTQKQKLRNIGYYHGYKGYRYIRESRNRIIFSDFNQILALNNFDMQLKAMFYPKVMYLETALKNYVIEEVLSQSRDENLDAIFNSCINYYKGFPLGSDQYKKEYSKRLALRGKINNALMRDYNNNQKIVNHFFDRDKSIPIWAIFESLTLGEFGTFFSCLDVNVKCKISKLLNIPWHLDADGKMVQFLIYALKDLRNAIAHNNVIFDTRFKTSNVNLRLVKCMKHETGITSIDFNGIEDYIILIVYMLKKIEASKTELKQFINGFNNEIEQFRNLMPISVYNQIIGTDAKNKLKLLKAYI